MIERWRLLHYTLPLLRPLTAGSDTRRHGVLLEIQRGDAIGYGEAAPITGFHPETLDDVVAQLRHALHHGSTPAAATARFCLEGAQWSLNAATKQCRPAQLHSKNPAPSAPIQALIDAHDPCAQAQALTKEGCTAAKIKVGRRDPQQEVQDIHAIATAAPQLRLRLDANRAWDLDTACQVAEQLAGVAIDYIEEPLQNPDQLAAFHDRTGMPFALDESLQEHPKTFPAGTRALVIKPTVVGGIHAARQWMARAQSHQLSAIISATFESGVGLGLLAELACTTHPDPPPQGLGTGRWLAGDVCIPALKPQHFRLHWQSPQLRTDLEVIEALSA